MKNILILATLTATPTFAHTAGSDVHLPHAAYLAVVALGAVAYAIFSRR